MLLFIPRRVELFIAGVLILSAVMGSPLWGVMKLNVHNLPLWHKEGKNLYAKEQDQNVLSLIEPMAGMFSLLTFSGFLSFRHLLLFHTQPSNIKVVVTHL